MVVDTTVRYSTVQYIALHDKNHIHHVSLQIIRLKMISISEYNCEVPNLDSISSRINPFILLKHKFNFRL